jgi:hypothetical protein
MLHQRQAYRQNSMGYSLTLTPGSSSQELGTSRLHSINSLIEQNDMCVSSSSWSVPPARPVSQTPYFDSPVPWSSYLGHSNSISIEHFYHPFCFPKEILGIFENAYLTNVSDVTMKKKRVDFSETPYLLKSASSDRLSSKPWKELMDVTEIENKIACCNIESAKKAQMDESMDVQFTSKQPDHYTLFTPQRASTPVCRHNETFLKLTPSDSWPEPLPFDSAGPTLKRKLSDLSRLNNKENHDFEPRKKLRKNLQKSSDKPTKKLVSCVNRCCSIKSNNSFCSALRILQVTWRAAGYLQSPHAEGHQRTNTVPGSTAD